MKSFADYKADGASWITLSSGEYYPDILPSACELYKPVLVIFGQLLRESVSSVQLFEKITEIRESWMRTQLCRVFRKYVAPSLPVEMLKKKTIAALICSQYESEFRAVSVVQQRFDSRPLPDEVLCALLWEYKDRGKRGYDLTEVFFDEFHKNFREFSLHGPKRGGKDLFLHDYLPGYPNKSRPVDFLIFTKKQPRLVAIGFAHYDSDRGGSQEDSRTGEYFNAASEINAYLGGNMNGIKIIFLNDGPGLLLGSMWNDYARLERVGSDILVMTMRMFNERLTKEWLLRVRPTGE
jgi:hypothetical protein